MIGQSKLLRLLAALAGKACSPTGMHWTWDTYAAAASTARAIVEDGGKSCFFLTADYWRYLGYDAERTID